jgi:tripartite-type tricarboxylate transporter receptor subunit TctC
MLNRRTFVAATTAVAAASAPARAQGWAPTRPVRIIVPLAPGGTTDLLGRSLAQKFTETVGQPTVVENRAGGAQVTGTDALAKSAPDGHSLGVLISTHIVNGFAVPNLPFDPVADFSPIALIASFPGVLTVHPSLPVTSVAELLAYARARPGQLSYGMPGSGTSGHLTMELLKRRAGLDIVGIAYRGGGPALNDLLAGHIQVMVNSPGATKPLVESGRLRALATTAGRRSSGFPTLPTLAEAGVAGVETTEWYGLFTTGRTPPGAVEFWHRETQRAIGAADLRERILNLGGELGAFSPAEFADFLASERAVWGPLIREINFRVE